MYAGPPPDIWLLTGAPGADTSAVATALAVRFDRAAHIDGNALWSQIVAGREQPDGDLEGEAERQYELTIRNQCLLARSYAEAGFTPLLDFTIPTRHHLDAYRHYLMGGRLRLVILTPNPDATPPADLAGSGLWLNTSNFDAMATADAILARQDEALLR